MSSCPKFFSFVYASLVEFDIGLSSPFGSVLVCCLSSFLICQNKTKKEQNFHPLFRTNFEWSWKKHLFHYVESRMISREDCYATSKTGLVVSVLASGYLKRNLIINDLLLEKLSSVWYLSLRHYFIVVRIHSFTLCTASLISCYVFVIVFLFFIPKIAALEPRIFWK